MPITKLRPTFTFDQMRLDALKVIVPEAFADGKINWDMLREVLGEHLEDEGQEAEKDAILFYFKFPSDFKVKLPDLIGNYVPDWGVARVQRNGDVHVRPFVHETKGSTDVLTLQFPHERRKIRCAEKYFAAIGVNYLTIDPQHIGGWREMPPYRPGHLGF